MSYIENNNNNDNSVPAPLLSDLAAQHFADKAADRALALQISALLVEFAHKVLKVQQDENEARRQERAEIARNERRERGFSF